MTCRSLSAESVPAEAKALRRRGRRASLLQLRVRVERCRPSHRAEEQKHRASVEKAFCCLSPYFALSIAAKAATLRSQEGQPVAVNGIGLSRRHAEMCGHGRQIVGVMIHVMAAAGLGGAAMTAPVVGNHPETVAEEKHHLPCDIALGDGRRLPESFDVSNEAQPHGPTSGRLPQADES